MKRQEPKTREEWTHAVNLANFYLKLHSCIQYGLLTGGPKIKVERCQAILQKGIEQGITPDENYIDPELIIHQPC